MKKRSFPLTVWNAVAFAVTIILNTLAQTIPIGGKTTGQISDQYISLFSPDGLTFGIWLVIYALLAVFVFLQFRSRYAPLVSAIGVWFAVSCLLNALWILAWQFDQILISVFVIVLLWLCLRKLDGLVRGESTLIRTTFGIYYAWISVATVAAIFVYIAKLFPESYLSPVVQWLTVVAIAALAALTVSRIRTDRNLGFPATVIWALLGILRTQLAPDRFNAAFPGILFACVAAIAVIVIALLLKTVPQRASE